MTKSLLQKCFVFGSLSEQYRDDGHDKLMGLHQCLHLYRLYRDTVSQNNKGEQKHERSHWDQRICKCHKTSDRKSTPHKLSQDL